MDKSNRTAIAILRLVNAATIFQDPMSRKAYIREKLKNLSDQDLTALGDALKSMVLLTSGNVASVKDPEKYNPDEAKRWSTISSPSAMEVFMHVPNFDAMKDSPTKEDYETAKRLLPILGSSFMDFDEINSLTGGDAPLAYKKLDRLIGFETLYRGLKDLDMNAIKFLLSNPRWDIGRGVSTSHNIYESRLFAAMDEQEWGSRSGASIIFKINNPKKKGFISDAISEYDEAEIILSGNLKIDKWDFKARARMGPVNQNFSIGDAKYRARIHLFMRKNQHFLRISTMGGNIKEITLNKGDYHQLLSKKPIFIKNDFKGIPGENLFLRLIPSTVMVHTKATLE